MEGWNNYTDYEKEQIEKTKDRNEWSTTAAIGNHTLIFHQREDGTAIRSVRFLIGNPECAFKFTCEGMHFFI